ncbi:uncharacterized protein LOC108671178 [Hyalella azteca]|uniref:Uncharacterized protein LOC108671178 n=1 Tax=Hyalella azteca TaxID=294128 RepID=A0A8B7NLN7_HYAAZ|nr:uncharacterized protein LOC108671178 [Hyalella azteca]
MGWQQLLNNSSLPLKKRLHGALVAFLSSSVELRTQQKEDIVIFWLTRLVREKQATTWREGTDVEQEQVWELLDNIFSSNRLQKLVNNGWTCPITSAFPRSIVDVLGSPNLGQQTCRHVVSTVCSVISTPALVSVISNSAALSLQVLTALLDIAMSFPWSKVEEERLKREPSKHEASHIDSKVLENWPAKKKRGTFSYAGKNETDISVPHVVYEEKVLQAISILLNEVRSQLLVKKDDTAVKFCSQQLLRRLVIFETLSEAYCGKLKFNLLIKMENLIQNCLFSPNISVQYKTFLSFMSVEGCKEFSELSLIPVVLSSVASIMTSESLPAVKRAVSLFFEGFVQKFSEEEWVKMLACLLHMAGITLPKSFISCDSEALEFIVKMPLEKRTQEGIIASLLQSSLFSGKITEDCPMDSYLLLLQEHLIESRPLSCDWFVAMRVLLMHSSDNHPDEFIGALGEVVCARKPDEQSMQAVSDLLLDLHKYYTKAVGPVAFVTLLMESIILKKDKLLAHTDILPIFAPTENQGLKLLLPPQFLASLGATLGTAEPLMFLDIFAALQNSADKFLIPLLTESDDCSTVSQRRALAVCCWILSVLLYEADPTRILNVQSFAEKMAIKVAEFIEVFDSLLGKLSQLKFDSASYIGVLLLSHAFTNFFLQLLSNDAFVEFWKPRTRSPLSLVPHTAPEAWSVLQSTIDVHGDSDSRSLMLRLILLRLQHLNAERKRAMVLSLLSAAGESSLKNHLEEEGLTKISVAELTTAIASLSDVVHKHFEKSKEAPRIVKNLLCENLISGFHLLSNRKTIARSALSAYVANQMLLKYIPRLQGNIALLVPHLISVAFARLTSIIKSSEDSTGGKKRKRSVGAETVACDADDLSVILKATRARLDGFDKPDYQKKAEREDAKLAKASLMSIVEALNKGVTLPRINYSDGHIAVKIFNLILDFRLDSLAANQIAALLQAFMAILFLSDLSDKAQKKITILLLRCINLCYVSKTTDVTVVPARSLPTLAIALISMRHDLSSIFLQVKEPKSDDNLNVNETVAINFDAVFKTVLKQLVYFSNVEDLISPVTDFIVSSAMKTSASGIDGRYLQTAWDFVSICAQATSEASGQRIRYSNAAIRTLSSWCLSGLKKWSLASISANSANCILPMLTELLILEFGLRKTTASAKKTHANNELVDGKNHQDKLEAGSMQCFEHLPSAWELAEKCLIDNDTSVQVSALLFISAVKSVPAELRQKFTDETIARAVFTFFLKESPVQALDTKNIHSEAENNYLLELTSTSKLPLAVFLSDCSLDMYGELLGELIKRSTDLSCCLSVRTITLWHMVMQTDVGVMERRVKRSALRTLAQIIVRHLKSPNSLFSSQENLDQLPGLAGNVMLSVLELFDSMMKSNVSLPHQVVMHVLSAVTVSTRHLSPANFALVWKSQVSLLMSSLISRTTAWKLRVSGLLSSIQLLIQELVWRSRAEIHHSVENIELLTSCGLSLDQLIRKVELLKYELYPVLHLTVGGVLVMLQQHSIIAPVRSVLDSQIYKLLKMCCSLGLNHLAVSLPSETRPLLSHYRNNFNKYYNVKQQIE